MKVLEEIKKDFEWGKKTSERGYLNLDDEQVEWMFSEIERLGTLNQQILEANREYAEENEKQFRKYQILLDAWVNRES